MTSVSDVTGTELLPNGQDLDTARAEGARAYELDRQHVFHSWSAQSQLKPMTVLAAQGSYLWDGDGNRLLDFSSQMVNTNIGHQHPKVVAAIAEQAAKLCTIAPQHANAARSEAARLIAELTPGDLNHIFFTNGGADANENAMRMARITTGRDKILTHYRSYHGNTGAAVVVAGLRTPPSRLSRPAPAEGDDLTSQQLRPWLLPQVYARIQSGQGEYLAELRPAVALFVRFSGLNYDQDEEAGQKLNAYVGWVQKVAERLGGSLLDLTIGDKGSYLYVSFGALLSHENDTERAVRAGLALSHPPAEFDWLTGLQIGISKGIMRAGAYGGRTRRTYGVLGDEVNLAARLMMAAKPGQILVSEKAHRACAVDDD